MSNLTNQPFNVINVTTSDNVSPSAVPAKVDVKLINGLLVPGGGNILIAAGPPALTLPSGISSLTGGSITSIEVMEINGIYKYQILVKGNFRMAPWNMTFTDQSNDTYHLGVTVPILKSHYVQYNSSAPSIYKITLSN